MSDNDAGAVDIHYHIISPDLAEAIAECVPIPSRYDTKKKVLRTTMGTESALPTEDEQLAVAKEAGIDTLWLSVRTPSYFDRGLLPANSPHCLTLARVINDYLASMCRRYPGRFMAFADVPLGLGEAAIDEMKRALNELGLHGVCLYSNYDGKPLDVPEFRPFLEEANRLRAPIFIHPTFPIGMEQVLLDYHMYVTVAFPYDTTLTIGRLAYAGVLEQLPDLSFILSHAGGTIPFLWWRMDYGWREDLPGCHDHIKAPPTEYLKRSCYYDTALTDMKALMLTYDRVGGDRMMLGTDSPYRKDALTGTMNAVRDMDIDDKTRAKILGGNALELIRCTRP